jgi:hypothetical protein
LERRLALTPSVASLQTLTLRSSVRFRSVAPHHRSPTSAIEPAGQDLAAPLAPEIYGQYRSNGARMPVPSGQCCRSRSATFDRRIAAADHSREIGSIATACLARSSSPARHATGPLGAGVTTHSRSNGDFPVLAGIAPNWRSCLARFCLCTGVLESPRPFRPLCLCPENSVSRQRRLRFEETGSNAMSVRAAPSPTALSPQAEHPDLLQARPAKACRVASHDGDDSAIGARSSFRRRAP